MSLTRTTTDRQPGASAAGPRGPGHQGRRMPGWFWGALLLSPAFFLVLGVIAAPIAYLVRLSFTDAHAYLPKFGSVGFDNYVALLRAPHFWDSVRTTVWYAGLTVGLQLVLGVLIALLLHQRFRGRGVVRLVALAPYMVPSIVVALVWRWLLDPTTGAYSWAIDKVWPGSEPPNLLSPSFIFWSLVVVSVWMFTPFIVISVLARLQTIDPSTLEAATVDGAGAWRRFWSIVLPELKPVLYTLILLRFMFMFTKFDVVYLFAGTGTEVRTLPVLTFQRIFGEARLGSGAAVAMILFVLLMIFTTVYLRTLYRQREETA
ncbi:carbohydrate ABC transporter permease [Jiangella asiatica]|uniref:Sugar ABC transporter permease n=1 Tax=Jiangella asiatica TaxID=2530372 RepID=A0A4R5CXV2_9ACTN|nr:sugar ABC transporter permease [Jiangella asiatica]TDE03404.1 sugar ABC transporter permease [Jiangella asiatica]